MTVRGYFYILNFQGRKKVEFIPTDW
jgi:hypothetical protein